jgi:hypothetical protein
MVNKIQNISLELMKLGHHDGQIAKQQAADHCDWPSLHQNERHPGSN